MPNTPQAIAAEFLRTESSLDRVVKQDAYDLAGALNQQAAATSVDRADSEMAFIAKVATDAYKVTDDDFSRLRESRDEEQIYELIWAAVLGAADSRYAQALRLLEDTV